MLAAFGFAVAGVPGAVLLGVATFFLSVLPQFITPDADIYAVYPQRHQLSARVRAFVDYLAEAFAQQRAAGQR